MFGGIVRDASGAIISAASLKITYMLVEADRDSSSATTRSRSRISSTTSSGRRGPTTCPSARRRVAQRVARRAGHPVVATILVYPNTAGAISRELRK